MLHEPQHFVGESLHGAGPPFGTRMARYVAGGSPSPVPTRCSVRGSMKRAGWFWSVVMAVENYAPLGKTAFSMVEI